MDREDKNALRQALSAARGYAILFSSLLLVGAGMLILLLPRKPNSFESALGTALVATGLISFMWAALVDRWQTKRLRMMLYDVVNSSVARADARITLVGLGVFDDQQFQTALSAADRVYAVCIYDQRWTETWARPLQDFLDRGREVTFILPDHVDIELMNTLAERHQVGPDIMQYRVQNLTEHLRSLQKKYPKELSIALLDRWGPSYTAYLFVEGSNKGIGVIRTYGQSMTTGSPLPEIVFDRGGAMYSFVSNDFEALRTRAHILKREERKP